MRTVIILTKEDGEEVKAFSSAKKFVDHYPHMMLNGKPVTDHALNHAIRTWGEAELQDSMESYTMQRIEYITRG